MWLISSVRSNTPAGRTVVFKKKVVVIRVKNPASWEGFDVVMAELDLGKKVKGSFLLPFLQAVQSKGKHNAL